MSTYMVVSHKNWEPPISRIWLAEIDIESGLYLNQLHFPVKKYIYLFIYGSAKS